MPSWNVSIQATNDANERGETRIEAATAFEAAEKAKSHPELASLFRRRKELNASEPTPGNLTIVLTDAVLRVTPVSDRDARRRVTPSDRGGIDFEIRNERSDEPEHDERRE